MEKDNEKKSTSSSRASRVEFLSKKLEAKAKSKGTSGPKSINRKKES